MTLYMYQSPNEDVLLLGKPTYKSSLNGFVKHTRGKPVGISDIMLWLSMVECPIVHTTTFSYSMQTLN